VLTRLPDYPAKKIDDLLPWNWKAHQQHKAAVAA
jgi:transposase